MPSFTSTALHRPHPWRRGPGSLYRRIATLRFLATRDRGAAFEFVRDDVSEASWIQRVKLLVRFMHATNHVRGYHTLAEMLTVAGAILRRKRPTVVECGAGYGASTAKLSLATELAGGQLHVFDSFRGIPDNDEVHRNLDGREVRFRRGAFSGSLARVQRTVLGYGAAQVCRYHRGWFEDTLPDFEGPIDVALLDVDLASSTRTCLRCLIPQMAPGGVVFSQDGHLRATHDLLGDEVFWEREVGVEPPIIEGLGTAKLLVIRPRPRMQ